MTFIITGAASGLGKALTDEARQTNHKVIGLDRSWPDEPHQENLIKVDADLANHEALSILAKTIAQKGPIKALIHNAAISATGQFETIPSTSHKHLIDVNLTAPLLLTSSLLKENAFQKGSSIIFIASLSVQVGYPGATSYAASKAALANYANSLRKAIKQKDIHVMTVYPGPMKTVQASRHAPKGAKEETRMAADEAAIMILQAMEKKKKNVIPGTANTLFALGGKLFPSLLDKAMRKIIYDKLENPVYEDSQTTIKKD